MTNVQYKADYILSDVTASGEYNVTASVHIMQQATSTYFSCSHTNRYWNAILNYIVIYKVKSSVIYIMVHTAVAISGE